MGIDLRYKLEHVGDSFVSLLEKVPSVAKGSLGFLKKVPEAAMETAGYIKDKVPNIGKGSFDFLKKVDAIIAGASNILLEAALMNVFPLYYDFAQTHLDWYGFQRSGLVECLSEPEEVCRSIKEICQSKPSVRTKAKLYCATIGTCYDGRSGELAGAMIQKLKTATIGNTLGRTS